MSSRIFDVKQQLTFYGAYHANKTNVLIHITCVPLILLDVPSPDHPYPDARMASTQLYTLNEYMAIELNWTTIFTALYLGYYYILEPVASLVYTPQLILSLLTATAFAHRADFDNATVAGVLNGVCWVAQFVGHGVYERRAPALLDNIVGALVLAPFFVHLELLFSLGYREAFHKEMTNEIGKEITRIRKLEGDERRAKESQTKKEL